MSARIRSRSPIACWTIGPRTSRRVSVSTARGKIGRPSTLAAWDGSSAPRKVIALEPAHGPIRSICRDPSPRRTSGPSRCTTTRRAPCCRPTRSSPGSIAPCRKSRSIRTAAPPSGSDPSRLPARKRTGCKPCLARATTCCYGSMGRDVAAGGFRIAALSSGTAPRELAHRRANAMQAAADPDDGMRRPRGALPMSRIHKREAPEERHDRRRPGRRFAGSAPPGRATALRLARS